MKELFAAILASTFLLGSTSGFAADAAKKPELTKEERADIRTRAEKLTAERAAAPAAVKTASGQTTGANKQDLTNEERMEMRSRAEKLTAERATTPAPAKTAVEPATKGKKHHTKAKKVSRTGVKHIKHMKHTQPKA